MLNYIYQIIIVLYISDIFKFFLKRSDNLSTIGVIAEFNPLHKGHEYLLKEARKQGPVVCVISSNFVQRGDTAIAEKRLRTKFALQCGADLVLELPVLWSMSTAQNFALGSVSALGFAGCDKIIFGSECGNIETLEKTAQILSSAEFSDNLAEQLKTGVTFAAAREKAALLCGAENILSGANNILGIEYITAAKNLGFDIEFETLKRIGAAHDSLDEAEFVSASLLRKKLLSGEFNFCKKYIPEKVIEMLNDDNLSDIRLLETAILATLRTRSIVELSKLPDISEGVENKLFSAIRLATDLDGLYNEIKVKRYTLARIRRLVLSAFIGSDNSFFMKPLPYLRVLGFTKEGQTLLKNISKTCPVPVITKVSEIANLEPSIQKVFETECKATDLFCLSLKKPQPCGLEYTAKIIKTE